ncbi:hypothetical protein BHE74_00027981 [Ensete ventricosum]|nr:hypothetical protein BHE74_00027981 [Ensete ventricosum]
MLQWANQYIATETLVAGKQDDLRRTRSEKARGQSSKPPKRRVERLEVLLPRPPLIPLNSTRTKIFLQIREKGLLRPPNPIKMCPKGRDRRRYCHFHQEHGYDTKECHDLRN